MWHVKDSDRLAQQATLRPTMVWQAICLGILLPSSCMGTHHIIHALRGTEVRLRQCSTRRSLKASQVEMRLLSDMLDKLNLRSKQVASVRSQSHSHKICNPSSEYLYTGSMQTKGWQWQCNLPFTDRPCISAFLLMRMATPPYPVVLPDPQ